MGLLEAIWTDVKNRIFYFLVNPQKQNISIKQTARHLKVDVCSPNPYFIKYVNDVIYEALASYEETNGVPLPQEKEPAVGRMLGFNTKEMLEDDDD